MIDQGNFRVAILALIIIGLMTCSLPQPGSMQLWADVSEAEPVACIEDVSVISELARVNDAGYESGDTDTRIDSLIEPETRVWVIQRCTALWCDEARRSPVPKAPRARFLWTPNMPKAMTLSRRGV